MAAPLLAGIGALLAGICEALTLTGALLTGIAGGETTLIGSDGAGGRSNVAS